MCRFALYLGTETTISSLVTEPSNSIIHQSFHSHLRREPLNGDGFGVAWYVEERAEPVLFRDITPAWNNLNLKNLAPVTRTSCLLAHVRAATHDLPVQQLNCHPFAFGPFAFMHNGTLAGFHHLRRRLIERLSEEAFGAILGSTDTEHIFGLVIDLLLAADPGSGPLAAMESAIRGAIAVCEELRDDAAVTDTSLLNLALTDGKRAVVSRFTSGDPAGANTLFYHSGLGYSCDEGVARMISHPDKSSVIIASEPLSDDPGWVEVPPNRLVTVDEDLGVEVKAI